MLEITIFAHFVTFAFSLANFYFTGYILAGLWGAKIDPNRPQMSALAQTIFKSTPRQYWDYDQALLRRIIWPEAVKDSLQHDSYSCAYPKFNAYHPTQPFPTPRKGRIYVGWGPTKGSENQTGIKPCPPKCRADPSWIFCWSNKKSRKCIFIKSFCSSLCGCWYILSFYLTRHTPPSHQSTMRQHR